MCLPCMGNRRSRRSHLARCPKCPPGTSCSWIGTPLRRGRSTCRAHNRCSLRRLGPRASHSTCPVCRPHTLRCSCPRAGWTMFQQGRPCTLCGPLTPARRPNGLGGNSGKSQWLVTRPASSKFPAGTSCMRTPRLLCARRSKSLERSAGIQSCFRRSTYQHRRRHKMCSRMSASLCLPGTWPARRLRRGSRPL